MSLCKHSDAMNYKLRMLVALQAVACIGCSNSAVETADRPVENSARPTAPTRSPVALTEAAAEKVKVIMAQNELNSNDHLRVAVEQGGPTGFLYDLKFANDADQAKDEIFYSRGVRIAIDRRSMLFLDGTTIDFEEQGSDGAGFRFHNPNAVEQ